MKERSRINNLHCDDKVIDACSVFGMMDTSGNRFSGKPVIEAIANMHFRGNGLGGGFAVYGLYPEYANYYAFHIMYLSREGQAKVENFLRHQFNVIDAKEVPTKPTPAIAVARRYPDHCFIPLITLLHVSLLKMAKALPPPSIPVSPIDLKIAMMIKPTINMGKRFSGFILAPPEETLDLRFLLVYIKAMTGMTTVIRALRTSLVTIAASAAVGFEVV